MTSVGFFCGEAHRPTKRMLAWVGGGLGNKGDSQKPAGTSLRGPAFGGSPSAPTSYSSGSSPRQKAEQHDRAAGTTGGRGDQAIEQVGLLDGVAAAECLDDALDKVAPLAGILHEVKIFVRPDLLDADEHGVEPNRSQGHHAESPEVKIYPVL